MFRLETLLKVKMEYKLSNQRKTRNFADISNNLSISNRNSKGLCDRNTLFRRNN